MNIWIATSLAILVAGLVWFDHRKQRIPNWVTLPLLGIFVLLNWPGVPETWLGCVLLFLGWKSNWLGGGDAKLWMTLLWAAARVQGDTALFVMAVSFLLTGLAQILWRRFRKKPLTGKRTPAAWRTWPYIIWLLTLG